MRGATPAPRPTTAVDLANEAIEKFHAVHGERYRGCSGLDKRLSEDGETVYCGGCSLVVWKEGSGLPT